MDKLPTMPTFEDFIGKIIVEKIAPLMKEFIEDALKVKGGPHEGGTFMTVKQAADEIICSEEYIRGLQDKGDLTLCFLPGSKHRRVLRSEVLELTKKMQIRRALRK